jgi:hypothetical protein
MPKTKPNRKALFQAALKLAGLTAEEWAIREGITPEHLSVVLNGKRESKTLTDKIDEFARSELLKHTPAPVAIPA